jgi:Tfp pilus assembly protein PilO
MNKLGANGCASCHRCDGNDENYCNWDLASKIADVLGQDIITRTTALQTFNTMQHVQNCIDELEDKLEELGASWSGDFATAVEIARLTQQKIQLEEYVIGLYRELGDMFGIIVE